MIESGLNHCGTARSKRQTLSRLGPLCFMIRLIIEGTALGLDWIDNPI